MNGAPGNTVSGAPDADTYHPPISEKFDKGIIYANGSTIPIGATAAENDSPGVPTDDKYKELAVKNESYQDYIMYNPPAASSPPPNVPGPTVIDVPLFYFQWSWSVDVTSPTTPLPRSWKNWGSAPTNGTITIPAQGTAQRIYACPTWSSVVSADLP